MKSQMERSISIDKNKETASHESEIRVHDPIKRQVQLEQRRQKLNQELEKTKQHLECLTKKQKEIKEKIESHLSANEHLKILFDHAQELEEAKNHIDSSNQLKEEEIKKLIKDQEDLKNKQNKLEQDKKELKQSMDSLQLLERKLNDSKVIEGFSISQSGDSRRRRSEYTISDLIQVLKQANAAVGDSLLENHKLDSIESWSQYIRDHEKITSLSEKEVIEWWMP
jgi:chromosome segregation ATPase